MLQRHGRISRITTTVLKTHRAGKKRQEKNGTKTYSLKTRNRLKAMTKDINTVVTNSDAAVVKFPPEVNETSFQQQWRQRIHQTEDHNNLDGKASVKEAGTTMVPKYPL